MLVIAEVVHFIDRNLGFTAERRFLEDLMSDRFRIEPVVDDDWPRIAELVEKYGDQRLGSVDASVVATAERLEIAEVATVDRRHFSVVRPRHVVAFNLLPVYAP
jgi:predicted nucleic acid-binding protein